MQTKQKKQPINLVTQNILGYKLVSATLDEVIAVLAHKIGATKSAPCPTVVFTPNPEQIIQATRDHVFTQYLQQADLLLPDGMGLIWASWWLYHPLLSRITGVDVTALLLQLAASQGWRVMIVGGRNYAGRLDKFVASLQQGLAVTHRRKIASGFKLTWTLGYQRVKKPTQQEETKLVTQICKFKPQLVLVAFGAPDQEAWIVEHLKLLQNNQTKVAIAVGGAMDMLLGLTPRAPVWLRRLGLEWLYRLVRQPWRLIRQLRLVSFVWLVFKRWLKIKV